MTSLNLSDTEFKAAVDEYYKLKGQYEAPYKKFVENLVTNDNLTNAERRGRLATYKKKCVGCGSLGGTVFTQTATLLTATCGNTHNPCRLNLRIPKKPREDIITVVDTMAAKIEANKAQTIRTKLDFLFGFKSESATIAEFNKLKAELIADVKEYRVAFAKYLDVVANYSKKREEKKKQDGLAAFVQKFKELIAKFEETRDDAYLKEATELYLTRGETPL